MIFKGRVSSLCKTGLKAVQHLVILISPYQGWLESIVVRAYCCASSLIIRCPRSHQKGIMSRSLIYDAFAVR